MITLTNAARTTFTGTLAAALLAVTLLVPATARAGVFFSVSVAPPVIPVYDQPLSPGDGYLWTPGYWAYGDRGYFWVEGAWVEAPYEGALWTPGYWAYRSGSYLWNPGYWGNTVGYYGGVDYGFGYAGTGFYGGYWNGGHFFYNRESNRLDIRRIQSTYNDPGHGGAPVHPGGRGFDPHPPTWSNRGETGGDDRGSRINDDRDFRSPGNAPDSPQVFRGSSQARSSDGLHGNAHTAPMPQGYLISNGRGTIQDNHIVATPNPRQGNDSPEVNQGFHGNAHTAPVPQALNINRNGFTPGQQNSVQQYRPPQQDAAQPYRPNQGYAIPQYRLPQQHPYNATPPQATVVQPTGRNFDRFQSPSSTSPQSMPAPSFQQPHSRDPGAEALRGSFGGGRR